MTPTTLSTDALADLEVGVPTYDRSGITAGIVHLGVGGFHRAHQAMYLDRLLAEGGSREWGICGIGILPQDARMRDALAAQDHLYTLMIKHPDGHREPRVIGSIVDYLLLGDDPAAAVARLADPATRIVSLTVTEGGYNINNTTGEFAVDHPAIRADVADPDHPRTTFGLVVAGLLARRGAGLEPFTVLSCDNIQGNGDVARRVFSTFAGLLDDELGRWVADQVAFPNCMVDRITPGTVDADRAEIADRYGIDDAWPVVCEPFTQWVVEDHFPLGRPAIDTVGAQLVADVAPYEKMKLRLLNAGHQGLAYLGTLAGHHYVHDTMADPVFAPFLQAYWHREAIPTLDEVPGVDLDAYCDELVVRFGNPEIADTNARLAFDGSERMSKWVVPVIADTVAAGRDCAVAATICAGWTRYHQGKSEDGSTIEPDDQRLDELRAAAARTESDPLAFLRQPDIFGDLAERPQFTEPYLAAMASLRERGVRETLADLVSRA